MPQIIVMISQALSADLKCWLCVFNEIGTIQRRLTLPLLKDDTHKTYDHWICHVMSDLVLIEANQTDWSHN